MVDLEQVKVTVEQLSHYVAKSDGVTIDCFESAAPHVQLLFTKQEFEQFSSLIENYAFSEAYEQLMAAGEKNALTPKAGLQGDCGFAKCDTREEVCSPHAFFQFLLASLHLRAEVILRSDPARHTVSATDLLKDLFERR